MTRPRPILAGLLITSLASCGGTQPFACAPWGTPEEISTRPSPFDSLETRVGGVRLKLCYSRPSARGRVVFGELVPFDTLWRTGANEATVLHVSGPVTVAGVQLDEGDYSVYTVPRQEGWSLVLNAATGQWGLTQDAVGARGNPFPNAYTAEVRAQEIARAPIDTEPVAYRDTLTASFHGNSGDAVDLVIDWEETRIRIPISPRPVR